MPTEVTNTIHKLAAVCNKYKGWYLQTRQETSSIITTMTIMTLAHQKETIAHQKETTAHQKETTALKKKTIATRRKL